MNMSYCRFQNTVGDLDDCADHLFDDLSQEEERARKRMARLILEMAADIENDMEFFGIDE